MEGEGGCQGQLVCRIGGKSCRYTGEADRFFRALRAERQFCSGDPHGVIFLSAKHKQDATSACYRIVCVCMHNAQRDPPPVFLLLHSLSPRPPIRPPRCLDSPYPDQTSNVREKQDAANTKAMSTAAAHWGKSELAAAKVRTMTSYCRSSGDVKSVPDPYYGGPQVSCCPLPPPPPLFHIICVSSISSCMRMATFSSSFCFAT